MDLRDYIASIPDYPEKGIVFRDISPLMANGDAYREATKQIVDYAKEKRIDMVAGGVSYTLGAAFYSLKNVRFMHVVWHLFVMLAAILMYFSVLFYT